MSELRQEIKRNNRATPRMRVSEGPCGRQML